MKVSDTYKESMVNAYIHYVKYCGLSWTKPIYKRSERLPNVPSSEQVDKIISGASKKYATIFSILRDTGLRPVELSRLTQENFDLEKGLVYPATAKGGRGRVLKLKDSTLAMLRGYLAKHGCKFPSTSVMTHMWMRCRLRASVKLQLPELNKYRLYDLRHYYATTLYHRTKDILHVMVQLGHRNLQHTLTYTHLVNFPDDGYVCAVARTVPECCRLVEAGFEYVTEMDGVKLFRKRK